ncbi:hypothetical protein [Candidatus Spongiihabitans sp.]|uniref:hypothetical protein n=1 Tax=Candidatus Spongiihabitans sp. TaxID=3101308 RepID=UPI003C7DA352
MTLPAANAATLDSRLPARMTNKGRHCPAHIIIGRAIQWNMSSGVAGLLIKAKQPWTRPEFIPRNSAANDMLVFHL